MPQNGEIQQVMTSTLGRVAGYKLMLYLLGLRIPALMHLFIYLRSWLREFKTGNISKTV